MRGMNLGLKPFSVALAVAVLAGCSKREEAETPTAPAEPAVTRPAPAPPPAPETPVPAPSSTTTPPSPTALAQQGAAAQNVAVIESAYVSTPEYGERVEIIYRLTDVGTEEAVAALGRLFQIEKDLELKTEIVDALFIIDGLDEKKAALLAAAAGADQAKDLRLDAIDALTDLEPKVALPVLKSLLNDPDPEIRDAAKDAIEDLELMEPDN